MKLHRSLLDCQLDFQWKAYEVESKELSVVIFFGQSEEIPKISFKNMSISSRDKDRGKKLMLHFNLFSFSVITLPGGLYLAANATFMMIISDHYWRYRDRTPRAAAKTAENN